MFKGYIVVRSLRIHFCRMQHRLGSGIYLISVETNVMMTTWMRLCAPWLATLMDLLARRRSFWSHASACDPRSIVEGADIIRHHHQ
jgi:hypothetical protein